VALAVIGVAQLVAVLDGTIVTIALPRAQAALSISDADRQWAVTGYALGFGGLLLLGGRVADYWGRRRTFLAGLAGFAVASGVAGAAQSGAMLVAGRAVQGGFAALLMPASLALLQVTFVGVRERARAFAVYGAAAAGGSALGLLLGGVLTEYLSWRWCLFVNVPIALVAMAAGAVVLTESRSGGRARYDVPGAVSACGGMALIVYAVAGAGVAGWGSAAVRGAGVGGVVLMAGFVWCEARVRRPLLPLRILAGRDRAGAYLGSTLAVGAFMGASLLTSYYVQQVLGYSPARAGVAALPLTVAVAVAAVLVPRAMLRTGPRWIVAAGCVLCTAGLLLLVPIGADTSYLPDLLVPLLLLGGGFGMVIIPCGSTALFGVDSGDAGAAGAAITAVQQFGGSVGLAVVNMVSTAAAAGVRPGGSVAAHLAGSSAGFAAAAGLTGVAAVLAVVLIRVRPADLATVPATP
jgi:EmrB/QacA subfamily drug resistance transporter